MALDLLLDREEKQVSKNIHRDQEVLDLAGRIWKTREELVGAAMSGSDPRLLGAARDYRDLANQRAQRIAHLVDGGNVKGLSMAKITYEPGRAVATTSYCLRGRALGHSGPGVGQDRRPFRARGARQVVHREVFTKCGG